MPRRADPAPPWASGTLDSTLVPVRLWFATHWPLTRAAARTDADDGGGASGLHRRMGWARDRTPHCRLRCLNPPARGPRRRRMIMRRILTRAVAIGTAILAALSLGAYALASTSTRAGPGHSGEGRSHHSPVHRRGAGCLGRRKPEQRRRRDHLLSAAVHQHQQPHLHPARLPGCLCPRAAGDAARQPGRLGRDRQHSGAHRNAGPGADRALRAGVQRRPGRQHHPTAYAARLRIYPPNQSTPTYAFWSLKGITVTGRTYLRVSPGERPASA